MKPILSKLNYWKKPDEDEEFVDKAVDSLFKKLKTKPGAIEELEFAISNPSLPSKCVTITRSLDGRLQVSHRKGLPHVIYCRIFRWPDLQTHHELRALECCEFPFSSKQNEVCINPYHYERVDIPVLPPVVVPKQVEFSMGHSVIYNNSNKQQLNPNQVNQQLNNSFQYLHQVYQESHHHHHNDHQISPQSTICHTPNSIREKENFHNQLQMKQRSTPSNLTSPSSTSSSLSSSSSNFNYSKQINFNCQINAQINTNFTINNMSYSCGSNNSGGGSPPQTPSEESENMSNLSPGISSVNTTNTETENSHKISYQEPPHWCSIVYYELNTRIGEIFHASCNEVFVDGYTNPCNNWGRRLCLGMFSNVSRNSTIENCRKHIGRGIHIYNDNGDVYVECLSESPIFIQSRNCNFDRGFHPNTVCKLLSGYSLRIFQSKLFAQLLNESVNHGYDAVYDLANMCVIKLSFVKGWGADYYRQEVSSCPCWIEIRLNGPFQWLDKVLKEMGTSSNPVTSVS